MDLISKAERDLLDITSWERAIIWSALSLRSSNVAYADNPGNEDYAHRNAVRINLRRAVVDGALTATLRIEATLPYNSVDALNDGGNFLLGLYELYSGQPEYYVGAACFVLSDDGYKTTSGGTGLEDEPSYIDTLEQYFVWACWQAELSLLSPLPSQLLPITVDFFEESTPHPTIRVTANIPIDYEAYKDCENLVCSCLPLSSQISPAGLRSITWEEITGKPSFDDVAFSGDYGDLANAPGIPSSLDQLNRFNELVRTINNTAPDPNTGNVDLTLNVGSVDWSNVNNKPTWHAVAFSGNYNDLTNTPSIPVLQWGNITGKPTWHAVAFSGDYNDLDNTPTSFTGDWANITGKPTWSTVAYSGSYNDLTDKPTIPDESSGSGGSVFLGKKVLTVASGFNLGYPGSFDYTGIVDWIGTNQGQSSFSNPVTDGKILVSKDGSTLSNNQSLMNQDVIGSGQLINSDSIKIDFQNYKIKPTKLFINAKLNGSQTSNYSIQGSNDEVTWTELGTVSITGTSQQWYESDLTLLGFYQYIRVNFVSKTGGYLVFTCYEVEFFGEVVLNNIPDGSQTYILSLSDLGYLLEPSLAVGTVQLLPLSTPGLKTGDRFYMHNPHPFDVQGIPASGDNFVSSNNLTILSQGQTAEVVKVNDSLWFAF